MKKLVALAAVGLVLFSFVFPNGVALPTRPPVVQPDDVITAIPDSAIVSLLSDASDNDRTRIVGVYTGLRTVLLRDKGARVSNTEKLAELQANTLQLAIDEVGKYPGLDVAIDNVFKKVVGTDDVVAVTPQVVSNLVKACETVIVSAQTK